MTIGYQVYNQQASYFVTFTIVDWVDLFSRKVYRDIVIESLQYCILNKGLRLYSYVIMTNHIHLIIQGDDSNLLPLFNILFIGLLVPFYLLFECSQETGIYIGRNGLIHNFHRPLLRPTECGYNATRWGSAINLIKTSPVTLYHFTVTYSPFIFFI